MAFIETRLSDRVSLGFKAKPYYNTLVVQMDNGKEARNAQWTRAKREYTASFTNWTRAMFDLLLDCFHAVEGSAYAFRFKDWTDYIVENGAHGLAPAGSTPLQLVKVYTFGAKTKTRTIKKPVAGTLTVFENGTPKAGTLDTTTGLFTPTLAWTGGATITASFEFDVPVRFTSDDMPASWDNKNTIYAQCDLIEDFQ